MALNVAQKLIKQHLVEGEMLSGQEIGIAIDQTLTQDATGTMVMLELEAMRLERVKTEISAQYVDHNLIQADHRNPDDHCFLQSACERFGVWFSPSGNGVSHPLHMEHFGIPGKTLLGSDSHSCAAGSMGMLAIGAGGVDVAMAMAGQPFYFKMPATWGIKLTGELPDWVSAKDVILEMLRRHDVDGGVGRIIEYYGPGLKQLTAMDRHVIANMGAELGATTSVFPADEVTQRFMKTQQRQHQFHAMRADEGCDYDFHDEINLSELVPLIARPSSPGHVVPVSEVSGEPLYQAYIGSSANPGYRDFAVAAEMVRDKMTRPAVSFDINPTSRSILETLMRDGRLACLIHAGARLHQAGCNGCIGMGQAPASGRNSLRTVPRNFPGRSGSEEDAVFLCSPETATASALCGRITDPRELDMAYPHIDEPRDPVINTQMLVAPLPLDKARRSNLVKGPNIVSLPEFEALPDELSLPVMLKLADNISTDEIMPAGARVLPYRSNIPAISQFVFSRLDEGYAAQAIETGHHAIIAGSNYGQGSSREHAAIAPRYLGLRVILAKSYARIHWQNLVNFGILPLVFSDPDDYDRLESGQTLRLSGLRQAVTEGDCVTLYAGNQQCLLQHSLSSRQRQIMLQGGLINWIQAGNAPKQADKRTLD